MPYCLKKEFRFEASHKLTNHAGKCSRLHGHSWYFTVEIVGEVDKNNMVIDYSAIKKVIKPIIVEKLDHWHLNDTLETEDPTSEYVAKWIYDVLNPLFKNENFTLNAVEVKETCTASCRFTP